jgi:hypothetical protein
MKHIDTMEKWWILARALHEKNYRIWQFQYSWDHPEGFHSWFMHDTKSDVEVVTRNEDVQVAIVAYNNDHRKIKKTLDLAPK